MPNFTAVYQAIAKVADPQKFLLAPLSVDCEGISPAAIGALPSTIEVDAESPQYAAISEAHAQGGLAMARIRLELEEKEGKWVPKGAEVL